MPATVFQDQTLRQIVHISVAGRSLRVSQTTVARRLEALEEDLQLKLFERGQSGSRLTEAGEDLVEREVGGDGGCAARDGLAGPRLRTRPDTPLTLYLSSADETDIGQMLPYRRASFGLDAMVGLIPGVGDVVGGIMSTWIIAGALRHRVPMRIIDATPITSTATQRLS